MEVRLARVEDVETIRAIYNQEVSESTVTFDLVPRTRAEQEAWVAEHAGVYPAVVAADADGDIDGIAGFGSLSPYRNRPAYATTVEDSVYVRRDLQRRGAGKAILNELVRLATTHGFHAVIGRIVDGHEASIGLHRACGFEVVGVEKEVGRKFGRWLDVVVMERLL